MVLLEFSCVLQCTPNLGCTDKTVDWNIWGLTDMDNNVLIAGEEVGKERGINGNGKNIIKK